MILSALVSSLSGNRRVQVEITGVGVCPNCNLTHVHCILSTEDSLPFSLTLNFTPKQAEALGADLICPGPINPAEIQTIPPEALR